MGGFAWVTLATNDSYSLGALILAHSLKQAGTPHQLAVLVTPGVTNPMREKLSGVFDLVQEVNILDSKDEANLKLLKRPELGVTFTKLHCWRLTQYEKCVFLDADTLVLQNCDELFEREELSAAPDVGWPDCFNSGVFVFRPSNETYEKLVQFALDKGSFDGGDQGLLNLYFSDWAHKDISKHLPFIYNMCSTACYSYLPAFKQFGGNAKIIHFIGPAKPWLQFFDSETRLVHPSGDLHHLQSVLQQWWNIFCEKIHPVLSRDMKSRNTHTSSLIVPPTPEIPVNPEIHDFSSPVDYQNVWNPWDEYDRRQTENVLLDYQNDKLINTLADIDESRHLERTYSYHSQTSVVSIESSHSLAESHHTNSSSITASHESHSESHSESQSSNSTELTDDSVSLKTKVSFHDSHEVYPITPVDVLNSPMLSDPYQLTPDLPAQILPPQFETTTTVSNHTVLHTSDKDEEGDAGLAGAFAQLTLGAPRSAEQIALENHLRRQGWEVGNIDYLGKDSFDNIWSKICETIGEPKPATEATPAPPTPSEEPAKPKAPTSSEVQPSPAEAPVEEAPKDIPTTQVLPPTPGTPVDVQIPSTKPIEAEPLICPIKQPEPEVCPIKPPEPVVAKPETPEAVTKPDIPEAAIKPQTPEATTKPELPEAVIKPQTPEATTKPDTPEVATKPQTPEAETKAQTPEATTKPVIPEVATKPQTPEAETKPQIPEAATKPQTPEAETKPQIPETATKPQTPEAITKPQTPEATTKPDIPEAAPKPQTPEAATKPETSPVESPIVPETPPVVAAPPKAPEPSTPTPKPEEASAAAATETTATPTPPPRKGSGGSKKASKPKK